MYGSLLLQHVTRGKWGQGSERSYTGKENMAAELPQFQILLEGLLSTDNDIRSQSEVSETRKGLHFYV